MAKIYGTPLFLGGGGGQNLTLPPMVTDLAAKGSNATITVSWTNPISDFLAGIAVVYNDDHMPEKPSDGTKVDAGLVETVDLTGLTNEILYYIRIFPYNEKKQYQTLIDGSTISATPNVGPAQVTNLQVTGTGSSPVLTWKNPTDDPTYTETVVVQKEDSPPTSISDGSEIYRGTGETVTASELERLKNYYWGVFTVNAEGGTRGPVTTEVYSFDFPEEPTEYLACETINSSKTWTAPEDGWYRIDAMGKAGDGGSPATSQNPDGYGMATAGGGGTGGHARSEIALFKGDSLSIVIGSSVEITGKEISIKANPGSTGRPAASKGAAAGGGGGGGTAEGGNKLNETGASGDSGIKLTGTPFNTPHYGGNGGSISFQANNTQTITNTGGRGAGGIRNYDSDMSPVPATSGSAAICVISRGNTNIASPSSVSTLSLTPRNASIEANWTNSGDPESVGTILVSNSDHIPAHPTDGISVDVAEATSYTVTDLPNNKPSYISLFAYNADKTKYSMAKSDVEIPREVTWYDVQEDLKADIANAQEEADYLTKENLTMANAGIMQVEAYCAATSNPPMADSGVFASGVKEWKPNTEYKLNDLFTYQGNMGYVKQPTLTSLGVYPPFSTGTEALYGARPKPDADGIYPYVYNMGIYEGMLVRDDDGFVYRSITGTQERPTELLYHPKDVPALLVKVEEEGGEEPENPNPDEPQPSEEYPEWVQPIGAHDAYAQDAKVSHNGKKWTSNVENNVWEPGVYGWTEVKE